MKKAFQCMGRFLVLVGLTSVVSTAWALDVTSAKLESDNDHSELTLQFDGPVPDHLGFFRVTSPARQIVDFPVRLDNEALPLTLNPGGRLVKAELVQGQGRTRLVLQVASDYEITKEQQGHTLKIRVAGPAPFHPKMSNPVSLPANSGLKEEAEKALGVKVVPSEGPKLLSWTLGHKEDGREVIRLKFDRSDIKADALLNNDRLRVRFSHGRLADGVPEVLMTKDGDLVSNVQIQGGEENLVLTATLVHATHMVRQLGNLVEVVLTPKENQTAEPAKPKSVTPVDDFKVSRYTGRPITLNFKDADIRTVMRVFADFTHMNLVLTDQVQGKVTVFLNDVPWDQALDIVLKSKNLISTQSGNVLLVSTPSDVVNDQAIQATIRARDDMEPLVSKTFVISYQKTADLVALIESDKSKLLSSRGTLISDERTSQIFVEDTLSRVERIASVIKSLDKPVKQVMIEAKVVLADATIAKDIGVRLKVDSSRALDYVTVGDNFGRGSFVDSGGDAATNFAYTLFNADGTRLINLQLKAFEKDTKVKTVSNPRVITSNKETALIEQGTEIPYQVATSSGATATEFKSANLKLEVTPQIAPDGSILLNVDVAKDSVGQNTSNGPAIDTRHVKTKVLVSDGGTVVLGGIFEDQNTDENGKIPVLGDIPVLGNLFKTLSSNHRKTELLIFLTPQVMEDQ
ncbi:MAG TPA: type IV pilus secretin PilQ [Limnobacter sp.]|uniref:type IV pilus secretin PilQ n=1 Tax=Limnobacter sp. TaxID=2003368 RepID=UPI002E3413D9|nr:type IV pilus secretin PilQ [Limnobacter sp.]HEX5484602.1 type IV pilus secretin PilQ [Limnobacter sp.]